MKELRSILLPVLIVALLSGCAAKTRYKVLSFFFDGVPSPEETLGEAGKGGRKGGGTGTAVEKPGYKEHGPYAAKQCDGCHVKASNRLVLPIEDLCFQCHSLDLRKKHLHGPLASGGCNVCHDPHGSMHPFLLVAEAREFCLTCHDANAIAKRDVHQEAEAQCTKCHDAHSSDNEYLLK
jgi:predicted CXXCH cytochrome family protein